MNTPVILTIMKCPGEPNVRPPATVAMILGTKHPLRVPVSEPAANVTRATRTDSLASPDDPAKLGEGILPRPKKHVRQARWHHGGINE